MTEAVKTAKRAAADAASVIPQQERPKAVRKGLRISRRWTRATVHPYDEITWELRSASIGNDKGEVVFEQRDVELPNFWTQLATNVVVSKYFRGALGTPQREKSVKQLIGRVANTIADWGVKDGYFATDEDAETFRSELIYLLVNQYAAFNSPVWFNVGIEKTPQCSACQPYHALINTANGLMPIGEIVEKKLIGLPVYDGNGLTQVVAVQHNGRKPVYRVQLNDGFCVEATSDHLVCAHEARRTHRVEWRRVDQLKPGMVMRVYAHTPATVTAPAEAKAVAEAALAGWLQADGFVGQYDQGTNQSLTVEFMTVDEQEFDWVMSHVRQVFPDHHYHVSDVPTKDQALRCRRIRLYGEPLRPFVERYGLLQRGQALRIPQLLWTAPNDAAAAYVKSLFQSDGYAAVHVPSAHVAFAVTSRTWAEELQRLLTRFGIYARLRQKKERRPDRYDMWELDISIRSEREAFQRSIGFISERKNAKLRESLQAPGKRCPEVRYATIVSIEPIGEMDVYDIQTVSGCYLTNSVLVHNCFILSVDDTMESILEWYRNEGMIFKYGSGSGVNVSPIRSSRERLAGGGTASGPVSFMKAADASAGVIKSGGKTRRAAKMVVLNSDHPDIKTFILCKWKEEEKAHKLIDVGYDSAIDGEAYGSIYFQNANNSVRVTDDFMKRALADEEWDLKGVRGGEIIERVKAKDLLRLIAEATWHCGDPGMQFDTTINDWHTCPNTGRINASNPCSEYMHLDNSACNLASINLMKFLDAEGNFLVEQFKYAVRIMTIAQDIVVDNSSYPTAKITENAKAFRELGLGYANLGALLMSQGIAYDSDEGRAWAGAISALMCGHSYEVSCQIAREKGPYSGFETNRDPQLRIIRKHRAQVDKINHRLVPANLLKAASQAWDEAVRLGEQHGVRNSQVTVIAPTGCLVGGSLVATDKGLMRLSRLGNVKGAQWQDVSFQVLTDEGPRSATKFYVNGQAATRRIRTQAGYEICGTLQHQVKVVDPITGQWVWKRFKDLQAGEVVPLAMNTLVGEPRQILLPPLGEPYWASNPEIEVPRAVTAELAELVGYFMGDGSLHSKGLRFCVTAGDNEVVDRLCQLGRSLFHLEPHLSSQEGYVEVAFHSVALVMWWEAAGFAKQVPTRAPNHTGKGYQPHIPDAVLASNDRQTYGAFLRGLFEADGSVTLGVPSFSTAHPEFAREVTTLLLALGYPTSAKLDQSGWGAADVHGLRVRNASYNASFLNEIGFMSRRKRKGLRVISGPLSGKRDYIFLPEAAVGELVPAGHRHRSAVLMSVRRHGGVPRQRVTQLYEETQDVRLAHALQFFFDRIEVNEDGGVQSTYDVSVPDNVTYLANSFISHNTIAFLMDCDTTGIEPDIALVKYKRLVGGGMLKIVNQTVPKALTKLGYDGAEIEAILKHINERETIEGAPALKPEHLSVFDCAFRPTNGARFIHYMGHVRMMGAVQPFISGAISKTVNLPEEASIEDITQAYIEAWRLGIKALAIYRDGSKRVQPLSTSKDDKTGKVAVKSAPYRRRLADERQAITHKFSISGHEGYLTVGLFEDGLPGEIFITMSKEGSTLSGLMDSFATMVSLSLQYGVPIRVLVNKFSHTRFEPNGVTSNKDIRFAKSIIDYIFRWMALKFLPAEEAQHFKVTETPGSKPATGNGAAAAAPAAPAVAASAPARAKEAPVATISAFEQQEKLTFVAQADAPACPECGSLMVRNAACYKCLNCGCTSGCS